LQGAKSRIVELGKRGVGPISVSTYLRWINPFWRCQGKDWKIGRLKEEQKILATRAHTLCKPSARPPYWLTILYCGLRASEALGLTKEDLGFENFAFKVVGKGNKNRLVLFSFELRKNALAPSC
jgi:integrase